MKLRHSLDGIFCIAWALLLAARAVGADLDFSDPAKVPPPSHHAIGFPNRSADFDALPGFQNPPPGYGEVGFYWWLGDPLTKERLTWQLDQLALVDGVMGLQINYAHSDRGGQSYGLTFPSEPALFSPQWWELVGWFMGEAKKRGMAISLSDYTLGVGQGWSVDELLKENPDLHGSVLKADTKEAGGGGELAWELPGNNLSVTGHRVDDAKLVAGAGLDLRSSVQNGKLLWRVPEGRWRVVAVRAERVVPSIDPMNPNSGEAYAGKFFGQFTDRHPDEGGRGLNWFFSDELEFRVHGHLWTARFAEEFRKRKGYDILPELPALFMDVGSRTPKVRLDFSDVKVALTEEGFFKPVFDWHQQRGMIYGCDHGGRGRDVVEFGDYFRTQRWNQGPGCDQPGLGSDIIKNKVAASIAHLYQRPRVWLEGYYGSGWGTSTEQLTDATFRNFVMGQNLLTLHGLYYSTHGGWWEWAPPCNHFRMPYWPHMKEFMACTKRLSFLLSQGDHRCDVAIMYPVAPMEAGLGGNESVQTAFRLGEQLYRRGIDFDFMDFESLARAKIEEKELRVSGERYRVLVLPAMQAVRWSTMQKAAEFWRGGGTVLAVGALPGASDRVGRDDPQLDALVKEVFGVTAKGLDQAQEGLAIGNFAGGSGFIAKNAEHAFDYIDTSGLPDFCHQSPNDTGWPFLPASVQHRKIGVRDAYAVYGVPQGARCGFRVTGKVELWDPWTGKTRLLRAISQRRGFTELRMPLTEKEVQLIVFSPGQAELEPATQAALPAISVVQLDGPWEFELQPTLDNRFGDFRWPPTPTVIGAEARRFSYADETTPGPGWQSPQFDDSKWARFTASFGPKFWKLGPLPDKADSASLENQLAQLNQIDPAVPVEVGGKQYRWQPYSFSWRYGIENDPGHQGYHGLKEEMHDDFIGLGKLRTSGTGTSYDKEDAGSRYYLWTSVAAASNAPASVVSGGMKPAGVWLNHARLAKIPATIQVNTGANPLLLRFDTPGRGFVVVQTGEAGTAASSAFETFSPSASWIWTSSTDRGVVDRCFRKAFTVERLPTRAMLRITCDNGYTAFLNGQEIGRGNRWEMVQEYDVTRRLQLGANVIAVLARNEGADAGLIAEILGDFATPLQSLIATDATWLCAAKEEPRWRDADFEASRWAKAWPVSNFDDSLWAKHQQGPPRVETPLPARPVANFGSLAMNWFNQPGLLTFDTRPQDARPAGWYRFVSPPGLRGLTIVARGKVQAWADGQEMPLVAGQPREDGLIEIKATVLSPAVAPVVVALRIEQERGAYGGSALIEPIKLDCGRGQTLLGDWTKQGVLESYSGGAWYRKTVRLTTAQTRGRIEMDLGRLSSSAEVRINGRPAGIRVASPWKFDITQLVKPGENRVEVLVLSALGGHYSTMPTRYLGSLVSGLIGPASISIRTGTP